MFVFCALLYVPFNVCSFPVQNVSALKSPLHSHSATCAMNCRSLENGAVGDDGVVIGDVELMLMMIWGQRRQCDRVD